MNVYPLVFEPLYKPCIWGGDRIFAHFGRPRVGTGPVGESWELVDLEDDQSIVRSGPVKGLTLGRLRDEWGAALLGHAPLFNGRFPVLIKYLDAQTSLSVQVHPSEAVAARLGGRVRVKHEAWYVLAAEPGGMIYHGLEPGIDARNFKNAMLDGRVDGILRKIPVTPGCCYYLPSGTPHALGAGVLVAEVQTPSDITYRIYDWNRVDAAIRRPRELHIDQAIECIDFSRPSPPPMRTCKEQAEGCAAVKRMVSCKFFNIE